MIRVLILLVLVYVALIVIAWAAKALMWTSALVAIVALAATAGYAVLAKKGR